jgi:undecaprenyl diphosphate synthase
MEMGDGQNNKVRALGMGTKSVKIIMKLAQIRMKLLSFFTENWNRPKLEVDTLMKILINQLKELPTLQNNNIKLNTLRI